MHVEYTGRHTEVTPALKSLAEKKLAKLSKVLHGITNVHVILAVDKHRHVAELTVHSPHLDLAAMEESGDLTSSLTTVMEKLTRQAQKRVGKLRERKRRAVPTSAVWTGVLGATVAGDGGDGIARSRVCAAGAMWPSP